MDEKDFRERIAYLQKQKAQLTEQQAVITNKYLTVDGALQECENWLGKFLEAKKREEEAVPSQ